MHLFKIEKKNRGIYADNSTLIQRDLSPSLEVLLRTKDLLNLLIRNGKVPHDGNKYNMMDLDIIIKQALQYLKNGEVQINESISMEDMQPLSYRQIFCANQVSNFLLKGDYTAALHELFNCMDDNGRGQDENTVITPSEYILYISLIRQFIMAFERQQTIISLETKTENYRNILKEIKQIKCLTIDELKDKSEFQVYSPGEDGNKWQVITHMCILGGCEFRWIEVDTERDAYELAYIKTILGEKVCCDTACPECYAEYMRDCI